MRCYQRTARKFQFQTGAIKSKATATGDIEAYVSFNSKLVRLKGVASTPAVPATDVSIPNWCD